jgi:hypothetical protein
MTIYLYKKTHNITGLQYLGKTERDPFKYKGSGEKWVPHIKKHGYDVTTEILKECKNNEELKYWGLYYSDLWDVVNARDKNGKKTWANLKPESGDGVTSEFAKEFFNRPDVKEANIKRQKEQWKDQDYRKKTIENMKRTNSLPEIKQKRRQIAKEVNSRPEVLEANRKHSFGTKSWRYDFTIYHFIHKDGREEFLTQNDMLKKYNLNQPNLTATIKGRQKSISGWVLVRG